MAHESIAATIGTINLCNNLVSQIPGTKSNVTFPFRSIFMANCVHLPPEEKPAPRDMPPICFFTFRSRPATRGLTSCKIFIPSGKFLRNGQQLFSFQPSFQSTLCVCKEKHSLRDDLLPFTVFFSVGKSQPGLADGACK